MNFSVNAMEMNKLMNIVVLPLTMLAFCFILPPYIVFKLVSSIQRFVFKENVAGKVVLITGASSGIGEHLAYEYSRGGARLALVARRTDRLQKVAERARQLGSPDVIVITADVSKVEDCKRFVDKTIEHFGQLNHLVNNAGISKINRFEDTNSISELIPIMDINFWGSVYATHFAVPHLRKSKGKIIVISSSSGWMGLPRGTIYSASKAALIVFYDSLRAEFGSEIGITIVTPGLIQSEMTQNIQKEKGKFHFVKDLPTDVCAKAIFESSCHGDIYLTEPFWMRPLYVLKIAFPEVFNWILRWGFALKPRASDKNS